jgi:hypothetical protein
MAIRYLVPPDHWQVSGEDGKPDHRMMGAAWANLHGGYRGHPPYSGPHKDEAIAALKRLYKEEGIDTPGDGNAARMAALRLSEVKDGLVRVPLVYTNPPGTTFDYAGKQFAIGERNLEELRSNMAEREVPIDYEHLSAKANVIPPGWAKAAGWLARPDTIDPFGEGRKLLWGWARFTPAMLAMIKDQEYRYCSIDVAFKGKNELGDDVGTYLKALAMTNRPFLKDLPPIEISDEDYQELMGMGKRTDGKLAALTLSEAGARLLSPDAVHVVGNISKSTSASADHQEAKMAKLTLRKSAEGKHEVFDGDGKQVGEIDHAHLCHYSEANAGMKPGGEGDGVKAAEKIAAAALVTTMLKDAGCESMQLGDIKALIEKGRAGGATGVTAMPGVEIAIENGKSVARPAPVKTDAEQIILCVDLTKGTLKMSEVDLLLDGGKIKPSSFRKAATAEQKVTAAFNAGKLKPTQRAKALALCLGDESAFDEFIGNAKPVVDTKAHGTDRAVEAGEKPASIQFASLVSETMKDRKLSERQAVDMVIATEQGRALWEAMRAEELEGNKAKK